MRSPILRPAWVLLALLPVAVRAEPEPTLLRVCGNTSIGKPEEGASPHVLLQGVMKQLPQLRLEYTPLPWQRCLNAAAANQFDAVLSASHSPERAQHLRYPVDSQGQPDAKRRMFQLGYALFKRKGSAVQWDGDRITGTSGKAGEAIGAERGYSIVQFARAHGAVVEDRFPHYDSLLASLRLKRIAGVLISQEAAAQMLTEPKWAQDYELSGPSLQTKAYYLPVSAQFWERHAELVQQLWAAVAKERDKPTFQRQFSLAMSAGKRRDIQP